MEEIKCPHCGFYNLGSRDSCIRCGKPLKPKEEPSAPLFEDEEKSSSSTAIEAELIEEEQEQEQRAQAIKPEEKETTDFTPREFEPTDESVSPKDLPEFPSFDDSAQSRMGTETELSELSKFFKEETTSQKEIGEQSELTIPPEPAGEEESLSRIEIDSPSTSSASDFEPDFAKPIFPDFSAEEEPATSESAVSEPRSPSRRQIIFSGLADFGIYLLIYFLLVIAGKWALGLSFAQAPLGELALRFYLPLYLLLLVFVWFYQFSFISTLNQTIGGMVFNVEVLTKDAKSPPPLRAGLRALIYVICFAPLGLGMLPAIFGKSIPDKLSGTKTISW